MGPFPSDYRQELLQEAMLEKVHSLKIVTSKKWNFIDFQATDMELKTWQSKGLPTDSFSKENAIFVMQGRRWPLAVDP
jgi:dynein heavy chain